MFKKSIGLILIIAGHMLAIVSLIADYIGLGSYYGLNWVQLIGVAIGVIVIVFGLWLMQRKTKAEEEEEQEVHITGD